MHPADGSRVPLRCHHCGREVRETAHTRSAYRVDYYALHTGDVEPVSVVRGEEPDAVTTVLRLLRPAEIVTCVDCYGQASIRAQREQLFRPELAHSHDAVP